jgi:hypothetical protein
VVEGTTTPVQDYSWILGDEGELTCMEKFHTLYLPAGLFSTTLAKDAKNEFATIKRGCALYKQRQRALGNTTEVGGRKKGSKNKNNKKRKASETERSTNEQRTSTESEHHSSDENDFDDSEDDYNTDDLYG